MGLSEYKDILIAHDREYRESSGPDRQEIIQEIMQEMVAQSEGTLDQGTLKGLAVKIRTWYNNNKTVPLGDASTLIPVGTVWNYRLVVQHLHKDEISQIMDKTGLTTQDPGWIREFQMAVNSVIKALGGSEVVSERYGQVAKSWNEAEPPEELRRKLASKKCGPTVKSFLKKIHQQMGVAIVGFAAYRDEDGKLCMFDFCTKEDGKETFPRAHSQDVEEFIEKWGKWVSQKGVGNLRPNAREGDEDEIPKGPADEKWIRLLNEDDGVYTLKSWEEVVELKGNKHDVSHAFREVMRQAWTQSGRGGQITWVEISSKPHSLISPKFILNGIKLDNPEMMSKDHVELYWRDWVSKQDDGDSFHFLKYVAKDKGKGKGKGKARVEEEQGGGEEGWEWEKERGGEVFEIDKNIPLPCDSKTPLERTKCLEKLAPAWGSGKLFHSLVKLVDNLEDTDAPSRFENVQWPFVSWSWDAVHLSDTMHEDHALLDEYLEWLTETASELSEKTISKSQLQSLLLGAGLFLRDLEYSCFSDHEEITIPNYLVNTLMTPKDADPVTKLLQSIHDVMVGNDGDDNEEGPRNPPKKSPKQKGKAKGKNPRSPQKLVSKRKRDPTPEKSGSEGSQMEPRRSQRATKPTQKAVGIKIGKPAKRGRK